MTLQELLGNKAVYKKPTGVKQPSGADIWFAGSTGSMPTNQEGVSYDIDTGAYFATPVEKAPEEKPKAPTPKAPTPSAPTPSAPTPSAPTPTPTMPAPPKVAETTTVGLDNPTEKVDTVYNSKKGSALGGLITGTLGSMGKSPFDLGAKGLKGLTTGKGKDTPTPSTDTDRKRFRQGMFSTGVSIPSSGVGVQV